MEYIRCPSCKNDVPVTYLFCPYCGYDLRFIIRERLIARLTLKDKLLRMYMLFRKPFVAIEHIASAPDLMGGFILMVICSILLLGKFLVITSSYLIRLSLMAALYLFLASLAVGMLLWFSLAGVIAIAIRIVGGTGSFREILSLVGYAQVYLVIAHIVSLIALAASPANISRGASGASMVYVPFLLIVAFFVGYGVSYTHMLKKFTAISASISATVILVLFFYVL